MIKNWTGKILVSTPKMGYDSEFSNSVILLYEESAEHVAGIILNKPGTTKAKKINKKESQIMWNELSQKLIAKINGLNPYPGAWFEHNGNRIKILDAEIFEDKGKAGEVLSNNLIIGCKDKAIKINLIQKEGKKKMNSQDFLRGYKINIGDKFIRDKI